MPDLWTDLLACLDLEETGSTGDAVATYRGRNQQLDYHRCSAVNCSRRRSGSPR